MMLKFETKIDEKYQVSAAATRAKTTPRTSNSAGSSAGNSAVAASSSAGNSALASRQYPIGGGPIRLVGRKDELVDLPPGSISEIDTSTTQSCKNALRTVCDNLGRTEQAIQAVCGVASNLVQSFQRELEIISQNRRNVEKALRDMD